MKLKIATWNISGGIIQDTEESNYFDQGKKDTINEDFLNKIIEIINTEDIDIISFQEIITTERINYINKIINNTQLKEYRYLELSPCNLVEDTNCGLAILSKYKIDNVDKLMFTNPKLSIVTSTGKTYYTYDKGSLLCSISVNDKIINYINNHGFPIKRFNSEPKDNMNIYNEFSTFISKFKDTIVTGDFNLEEIKDYIQILNTKKEVFGEITTINNRRYDNIFLDDCYKLINKKMIEAYSDHFICIAEIEI